MEKSPDPRLVDECQVRPVHADDIVFASGERVKVLIGPPPNTCWHTTLFPPNPKVLQYSRQKLALYRDEYSRALARYRNEYSKLALDAPPYPWRLVIANSTLLPASLRGFMDKPVSFDKPDGVIDIASKWLFQDLRAGALFGITPSLAKQRLEPVDVNYGYECYSTEPLVSKMPFSPDKALAHICYQQWHQECPVFGRQVIVHLADKDRRASVTSSYLPLDDRIEFLPMSVKDDDDMEEIITLARTALAGYLDDISVPSDLDEWHNSVVPYAGSNRFVFTFAGRYRLAYQVELLSPDYDQAWRVFVDAETGNVLGRPENRVLHARYYRTAGDVLKTPPRLKWKSLHKNPCEDFMLIGLHHGKDPSLDPEPDWFSHNSSGPDFEATNIAINAKRIYNYFVDVCGADVSKLHVHEQNGPAKEAKLRARVAKGDDPKLNMGFNYANDLLTKLIVFQTDSYNGLVIDTIENGNPIKKKVHNPSYDPEVIYHEVVHGLMYLLNPKPFDHIIQDVPFGRALVEGYANYFARSLAATYPYHDPTFPLWAGAAYRESASDDAYWDDRWALSRNKQVPGADLLTAPNLYPHHKIMGLPVYDVGMIWARALWDLRTILRSARISRSTCTILRSARIDKLTLEAYNYVHGWVANFELAAEGLLDAAAKSGIFGLDQVGSVLFARRGILAGQSIQALLHVSNVLSGDGEPETVLLAGADAGLMRSTDDGQQWKDWDDLQGGKKLTDIVALAFEGKTFYAATEIGIYQRASDGNKWLPVGEWPGQHTPHSLLATGSKLYVGTGCGVWHYDAANGWESFNSPGCEDFDGLTLDLALATVSSHNTDILYAASFDAIHYREIASPADWIKNQVHSSTGQTAVIAVDAQDNISYLGTLAHGIWSLKSPGAELKEIASCDDLGGGAVLTLVLHDDTIIAGTTSGLYVGTSNGNGDWNWGARLGLPQGAMVTVVQPINNDILASTAIHGLWRWNASDKEWCEVPNVDKLTKKTTVSLEPGVKFGPYELNPGSLRVHLFWQPHDSRIRLRIRDRRGRRSFRNMRVYQLGCEVVEVKRRGSCYDLQAGFVIVSVENTTRFSHSYVLQVDQC